MYRCHQETGVCHFFCNLQKLARDFPAASRQFLLPSLPSSNQMVIAMKAFAWLLCAILLEVVGTAGLKLSEGFTKPLFTIGALCCYAASFYFLSVTLKSIPVGVAYAIWSGLGIVLTTIVGYFLFAQKLPMASVAGIVLIVAGVGIMMASSGH